MLFVFIFVEKSLYQLIENGPYTARFHHRFALYHYDIIRFNNTIVFLRQRRNHAIEYPLYNI
jgi:hypothetical protein